MSLPADETMSSSPSAVTVTTFPEVGEPPRALSSHIRHRAWLEPTVRFWWAASLVLLIIAVYFLVDGALTWRHESTLVESGVRLDATIVEATYLGQPVRLAGKSFDPSNLVQIEFSWHGQTHTTPSIVASGHKGFVTVGQTIHVRVNRDDPNDWTELTESEPLLHRTLGGLIPLPAALFAFCGSWWIRRRTCCGPGVREMQLPHW